MTAVVSLVMLLLRWYSYLAEVEVHLYTELAKEVPAVGEEEWT
jgi:hypothetical protein